MGIILASAFQRLLLYEQAYGFTRLRTYTHVFVVWLGILLAVLVALELARRLRAFPLAAFLCTLGFAITLNAINVDGLIVRQNVGRLLLEQPPEQPLDVAYLNSLSLDATPALGQLYQQASLPAELRQDLGGVLSCYRTRLEGQKELPWQSFTFARQRARNLLLSLEDELTSTNHPPESDCAYQR